MYNVLTVVRHARAIAPNAQRSPVYAEYQAHDTNTHGSVAVCVFFISGGVCADFCLHTAMVKRAQVHICYGDVDTSEHCVLFDLG